jgi:hypothetical protein
MADVSSLVIHDHNLPANDAFGRTGFHLHTLQATALALAYPLLLTSPLVVRLSSSHHHPCPTSPSAQDKRLTLHYDVNVCTSIVLVMYDRGGSTINLSEQLPSTLPLYSSPQSSPPSSIPPPSSPPPNIPPNHPPPSPPPLVSSGGRSFLIPSTSPPYP